MLFRSLVGEFDPSLAGSELEKLLGRPPRGPLPPVKATAVRDAREAVRDGIRSGALQTAHDIAEGGLAVALAECCLAGGLGAHIETDADLFAEAPGRAFVVSGPGAAGIGQVIGRVGGDTLEIAGRLTVTLAELGAARDAGLVRFG